LILVDINLKSEIGGHMILINMRQIIANHSESDQTFSTSNSNASSHQLTPLSENAIAWPHVYQT